MMMRGVRISLRVAPGSRTTAVVGPYRDGWKLRVAAAPEGGKANDAVVRLLARELSLHAHQVVIVSGHASRNKAVEIEGLSLDAVNEALARASAAAR